MPNRFKNLLEELKKLNFPAENFAIFGSGPMAVRGIRDVNDLDIIVKDSIWAELLKSHTPAEKKPGDKNRQHQHFQPVEALV